MTKDDDFKVLKIQTFTLKVSIHCDGCRFKVKKLLQKIEGVYSVSIDAENQKVTVTGSVDSSTVIKKLSKSGKQAQLISSPQKSNQIQKPNNQKQQQQQQQQQKAPNNVNNANKNNNSNSKNNKEQQGKQGLMQGLKAFKSQHNNKLPSFSSDEEDFYEDDDDEDDEDDEEMRLITEKMNQMNLMRQANTAAAAAAAAANAKKNANNGGNAGGGKKGGGIMNNQNQIKIPNLPDQRSRMANAAPNNPTLINGMMMGGGRNGHQQQQQQQQQMPMMGGHPSPAMMMNMNMRAGPGVQHMNSNNNMMMMHDSSNRYMQQQQPQMMYQRAPQVNPYTAYQYQTHHYPTIPTPYYFSNQQAESSDYGVHLFSDENANSCSVM